MIRRSDLFVGTPEFGRLTGEVSSGRNSSKRSMRMPAAATPAQFRVRRGRPALATPVYAKMVSQGRSTPKYFDEVVVLRAAATTGSVSTIAGRRHAGRPARRGVVLRARLLHSSAS